jgi:hypothetical protein
VQNSLLFVAGSIPKTLLIEMLDGHVAGGEAADARFDW